MNENIARRLRQLADIGIVNAREDTALLRMAADRLEEQEETIALLEERISIMTEGCGKSASDANLEEDEPWRPTSRQARSKNA